MWSWAFIIVTGIAAFFSFYMVFLAFIADDQGAFLFAGFGLLFGTLFLMSVINEASKRSPFFKKLDNKLCGKPKPISFVSHWFTMATLIISGIGILAALLISIF